MPARSTAYYLLLKHTSRTVDSYCSFLDIHLLRTPPCYVQLALHLVEGRQATTGTYPSCLALTRPANAAAQLVLRSQARRKEQGPPHLSAPPSPIQEGDYPRKNAKRAIWRRSMGMPAHFNLGVEEEFQIVDRQTGQLAPRVMTILEKGASQFGEKIKPEMLQSAVEVVTDVCPNITAARLELQNLHSMLLRLLGKDGLTLISAGTHPPSALLEPPPTPNERYAQLEGE